MQLAAIDWSNYTNNQLQALYARKGEVGKQLESQGIAQELARRGLAPVVSLPEAPPGHEWVMRPIGSGGSKLVAEPIEEGRNKPQNPPAGVDSPGIWVFIDPDWAYIEKGSGRIMNEQGHVIGKLGDTEQFAKEGESKKGAEATAETTTEKEPSTEVSTTQEGSTETIVPEAPPFEGEIPAAPEFGGPPAPPLEGPDAPALDIPGAPVPKPGFGGLPAKKKIEQFLTEEAYKKLSGSSEAQKASDELFKKGIKKCRMTFPTEDIRFGTQEYAQAYKKIIVRTFEDINKDVVFCHYTKMTPEACKQAMEKKKITVEDENTLSVCYERSKFDASALVKKLQDLDIQKFVEEENLYQKESLELGYLCLFDNTPDPAFEQDFSWFVSYIVASARTDTKQPTVVGKIYSDDELYAMLKVGPEVQPELILPKWLTGLRKLLTDKDFLKPEGLMVSYAGTGDAATDAKAALAAELKKQPVMKILTEPMDSKSPIIQKKIIQSIAFYLTFHEEEALSYLQEHFAPVLNRMTPTVVVAKRWESAAPKSMQEVFTEPFTKQTIAQIIQQVERYQKKYPHTDVARAIKLLTETPYEHGQIVQALMQAGLPDERAKELGDILTIRDKTMLDFVKLLHECLAEYKKRMYVYDPGSQSNKKNIHAKAGKKLYQEGEQLGIFPVSVKTALTSMTREPELVYTQVVRFLQPLGNPAAKKVTLETFSNIIEPYGTLIGVLQDFIKSKDLERLLGAITALQLGEFKEAEEKYPASIINNKQVVTVQKLYKDRLSEALRALQAYDFSAFNRALDDFISQSGTVANKEADGSISATNEYKELMTEVRQVEAQLFVKKIEQVVKSLNEGNYEQLPEFGLATAKKRSDNVAYLAALRGKLESLNELFNHKESFSINDYEYAYKKLLEDPEFLQALPQKRLRDFKNALLALFDSMAVEYKQLVSVPDYKPL